MGELEMLPPIWKIRMGHSDSLRLADYMYAEPGPFLTRKRERFDNGRLVTTRSRSAA